MNSEIPARKITVASAIITRGDKVLLLRRPVTAAHFPGCWQLPEGKVEPRESVKRALEREMLEELHCRIRQAIYFASSSVSRLVDDQLIKVRRQLYKVSVRGRLALSHEHDGSGWFDPRALPSHIVLSPGTKSAIRLYLAYARA